MAKRHPSSRAPLSAENPASSVLAQEITFEQAAKYHASGKLRQAELILRKILQIQPRHAFALHLLGVMAHQAGQREAAIQLILKAIASNPVESLFHSNLAEMYRQQGDLTKAIHHGEKAVSLNPGHAEAHSNLGIAHYDSGEMDKAELCQQKALEIAPRLPQALNNMGSILRDRKDYEGAITYYQKALAASPGYLESMNNLGTVYTENEQAEEAIPVLIKVVQVNPGYAEAHYNLGNAFFSLEDHDKAQIGYNQALKLKPEYAEAHEGLARIHLENNQMELAEAETKKALSISPDRAEAQSMLGAIFSQTGYPVKAEEAFKQALALNPELASAHTGRGHLMMQLGDFDAAEKSFGLALEFDVDGLAARASLAQVRKASVDDENMIALIEAEKTLDTLRELKAMPLHFALGKCYEDTGQYDQAFPHFLEGCRLKRKRVNYNADENDMAIDQIRNFFSKEKIDQLRGPGNPSDHPVFILGMPRSGTTLTEQIIASHPAAYGAGELPDLMNIANHPSGENSSEGYPSSLKHADQALLTELGTRYVNGLIERDHDASRITDKMPANFFCIGLIHLMLPNARIIHMKRNPLDTCLSNFSRMFNSGQNHSYELTELGRYYRNYAHMMDHWREVLPEDAFLEIQYEELVSDNEAQTRRLIDYCGLEWNDACLESHKTKRSIRTASVTQVREPIYTSSIEKWRRYEKFLGPLIEALGDLAPV